MIKNNLFLLLIIIFLGGCKQYNNHINTEYKTKSSLFFSKDSFANMNNAIVEISNQLLVNIPSRTKKYNKFVITTFVSLEEFTKTSRFGRVISESLIDEMHTRKFKILDFRSQESISVNSKGEFSLTRDIIKLRDEIPEALIVVGTYSIIENNKIVINARIINNFTSDVISTAKVIYANYDCKQFDLCSKEIKMKKPVVNDISIIKDNYL